MEIRNLNKRITSLKKQVEKLREEIGRSGERKNGQSYIWANLDELRKTQSLLENELRKLEKKIKEINNKVCSNDLCCEDNLKDDYIMEFSKL